MTAPLLLGIPSKGRMMDQIRDWFADAGLTVAKTGNERGYRGVLEGVDGVEIAFLSAAEIAAQLRLGWLHMGVTGEDLIHEAIADADARIAFHAKLGFGDADVVVAVPDCWIDVATVADLDDVATRYHEVHGRKLRVATKYMNLTRRFFARHGLTGYRIVESGGATEGSPAAATAELIVDITSTGATLKANHLKILDDGVILRSQASLVSSNAARWTKAARAARKEMLARLSL